MASTSASSFTSGWYENSHPAASSPSCPDCSNLSAISTRMGSMPLNVSRAVRAPVRAVQGVVNDRQVEVDGVALVAQPAPLHHAARPLVIFVGDGHHAREPRPLEAEAERRARRL